MTPHDPMDCSLSGSSVHGIFQARIVKWGAIAFSISKMKTLILKDFLEFLFTFIGKDQAVLIIAGL